MGTRHCIWWLKDDVCLLSRWQGQGLWWVISVIIFMKSGPILVIRLCASLWEDVFMMLVEVGISRTVCSHIPRVEALAPRNQSVGWAYACILLLPDCRHKTIRWFKLLPPQLFHCDGLHPSSGRPNKPLLPKAALSGYFIASTRKVTNIALHLTGCTSLKNSSQVLNLSNCSKTWPLGAMPHLSYDSKYEIKNFHLCFPLEIQI